MATLHEDYSTQMATINALRTQIEQLRRQSEDAQRNLFSKVIYETISSTDTNNFIKHRMSAGAWRVYFKLQSVPMPGSLQGSIASQLFLEDRSFRGPHTLVKNILFKEFWGEWQDFKDMSFNVQYVPDSRETNLIKRVEVVSDNLVLLDGNRITISP